MNGQGQVVMKTIIETKAETLRDFFQGLRGTVRVAQLLARVGSPHRFPHQAGSFWPYCGLAVVQRTSAEYKFLNGTLQRQKKLARTRGLNRNHCPALKQVFKGCGGAGTQRERVRANFFLRCSVPFRNLYSALVRCTTANPQ